jgi:hypothetical protein
MRQLAIIATIVAMFMYAGFAIQGGVPATTGMRGGQAAGGMGALQRALEATGAHLGSAVLTGWVQTDRPQARDRVMAALGWSGSTAPAGESREIQLRTQGGHYIVTVRWSLSSQAARLWQARTKITQEALSLAGATPHMTVQLEGTTSGGELPATAERALDALAATQRQPWSDLRAASVAGKTFDLPPSTFGVNIQVAVRHDALTGLDHVWVAWPALLQEY